MLAVRNRCPQRWASIRHAHCASSMSSKVSVNKTCSLCVIDVLLLYAPLTACQSCTIITYGHVHVIDYCYLSWLGSYWTWQCFGWSTRGYSYSPFQHLCNVGQLCSLKDCWRGKVESDSHLYYWHVVPYVTMSHILYHSLLVPFFLFMILSANISHSTILCNMFAWRLWWYHCDHQTPLYIPIIIMFCWRVPHAGNLPSAAMFAHRSGFHNGRGGGGSDVGNSRDNLSMTL